MERSVLDGLLSDGPSPVSAPQRDGEAPRPHAADPRARRTHVAIATCPSAPSTAMLTR